MTARNSDPKEQYNLASKAAWLLPVLFEKISAFQQTFAREPPIELGHFLSRWGI